MKSWLFFSCSINIVLLVLGGFAIHRLGGWRYALQRLQHDESSLYAHRQELFKRLPERPGAIIFLGDSQTALCEWRELISDTLPVINRGIVGDQVKGVAGRLEEILRHRAAKIFLLVGINDLLFGKSAAEIGMRYRELVSQIRTKAPATQLVLESILPVNNKIKNVGIQNAQIQDLNVRICQIAKDFSLPFADIYSSLTDPAGDLAARFTADGLHLNGAGYDVWKQQLTPFFKQQ